MRFNISEPSLKIIKDYFNNLELESRKEEYTIEEISQFIDMLDSKDEDTQKLSIDSIASMHPKYIEEIHEIQNQKYPKFDSWTMNTGISIKPRSKPISEKELVNIMLDIYDITVPTKHSDYSNLYASYTRNTGSYPLWGYTPLTISTGVFSVSGTIPNYGVPCGIATAPLQIKTLSNQGSTP